MMMRPAKALATAVTAALLWTSTTTALDVEIEKVECLEDYPVRATVYMACADGSSEQARCTFGKQIRVYGELEYSSVQQSGITNDIAYISASLSLFSISFDLVNKQVVPLCYESQQGDAQQEDYGDEAAAAQEDGGARLRFLNDNGAQCPSDGSYSYSVHYVLPSAGSESASWLASGWTGTGILEMYAQRNDAMKIGECHLTLSTYVTKQNNESLMGKPSAAATAGILLAVLLAALLMCFYCYCCIRSRKVKKDGLEPGDDITSNFRRMDTSDEHSKPPTITLDAMSQAKSKKSAKEMV